MVSSNLKGTFAFYGSVLAGKALLLAGLTIAKRLQRKSFAGSQPHPEVRAIHRCHANDIENLVPFLFLGFIYCKTNPSAKVGIWLFRVFALSRFLHTAVYLYSEGTFLRAQIFLVGYFVNVSLALKCISYYSKMY
uniref:Microsomal glutathione S-transferase 1 n=1 Tax=Trichobilharzia regenti TaxID=157069 RepID=A0AA85JAG5_TRIRE|nr:unnamed protein product [Trichobilharzia regenti]